MIARKQILTPQKEEKSIARTKSYASFLNKYPLYSVLLVLKDYENQGIYEECAIIKSALDEYKANNNAKIPKGFELPTSISEYKEQRYQRMLEEENVKVEYKTARDKATLIKLKLPI